MSLSLKRPPIRTPLVPLSLRPPTLRRTGDPGYTDKGMYQPVEESAPPVVDEPPADEPTPVDPYESRRVPDPEPTPEPERPVAADFGPKAGDIETCADGSTAVWTAELAERQRDAMSGNDIPYVNPCSPPATTQPTELQPPEQKQPGPYKAVILVGGAVAGLFLLKYLRGNKSVHGLCACKRSGRKSRR